MAKIVECAKVDPSSGCQYVVRGTTDAEVMQKAEEHAKQHGIRQMTPEMKEKVKTLGYDLIESTPQEFSEDLDADIKRWGPVAESAGIVK